jgi:hypothetical protein
MPPTQRRTHSSARGAKRAARLERPCSTIASGTGVTLQETVRDLASLDEEAVICAAEPFTGASEAIVVPLPVAGQGEQIEKPGFKYFLEVSVAREFIEGWRAHLEKEPTIEEKCTRLIYYAIYDA